MFLMWMQWFLVTYKLCWNVNTNNHFPCYFMHLLVQIITLKPFILISPVYNQCILSMIDYGTSVVNNMTITLFVDMNNYLFDKYLVKVKKDKWFCTVAKILNIRNCRDLSIMLWLSWLWRKPLDVLCFWRRESALKISKFNKLICGVQPLSFHGSFCQIILKF